MSLNILISLLIVAQLNIIKNTFKQTFREIKSLSDPRGHVQKLHQLRKLKMLKVKAICLYLSPQQFRRHFIPVKVSVSTPVVLHELRPKQTQTKLFGGNSTDCTNLHSTKKTSKGN